MRDTGPRRRRTSRAALLTLVASALPAGGITAAGVVAAEVPDAAVAPTAAVTEEPPALEERCWRETFVDGFDALDLYDEASGEGRWRTRYIWGRDTIINRERQYYLDPVEHGFSPFEIADGVLTISARPTPASLAGRVAGQPYVSGVLTSERSFAQKHGRFEARVRVPSGQGLWPALWLLPTFDTWPEGVAVLPEIDIMEILGHETDTLHTTLHTNQSGALTSHGYAHRAGTDLADDFHLYSVVWTPQAVHWYLDERPVASHPAPADFTRPVHFLMNLAVGGGWPGNPDASTAFPAEYAIDHVRAWESSGLCASS